MSRSRGAPEGDVLAVEQDASPEVGSSSPAIMRSVVVLPQPDGPSRHEELAVLDGEVDALDGGEVAERLVQVLEPDLGHGAQSGKWLTIDEPERAGQDRRRSD